MTTAVLVVAAGAAIVLALGVALVGLRARGEGRLQSRLGALDRQLSALSQGIGTVVERAEAERRRELLGELGTALGWTLDLQAVLRQAVELTASIPGADAALALVRVPGADPVVETRALPADAAWRELPLPPAPANLRTVTVAFDYGDTQPSLPFRRATAVPLGVAGQDDGHLVVYSYGPEELPMDGLVTLATRLTPAVRNALQLIEANERARTDALTLLRNRGGYDEVLELEIARARRFGRPLSLIELDLDDFGLVNKAHGDQVGDAVLRELAERIRHVVRATDVPCRRGGEEFAIVLPETTLERATLVCERLRAELAIEPFPQVGTVTFSAGVAQYREGDTVQTLDDRAGTLMRQAKSAGKNRCATEHDGEPAG